MAKADDIVHRMTSTPCFRQRGGRCGVQFALLPRWWRQHITARQARRVGILRSPVGVRGSSYTNRTIQLLAMAW